MTQHTYRVLLTPEEEGGFSVDVLDLPGCFTQGETIEEAIEMTREAISLYVESMGKGGEAFQVVPVISDAEAADLVQAKRSFLEGRTTARPWQEIKKDLGHT